MPMCPFLKENPAPAGSVSTSMPLPVKAMSGFCGNWTLEISVKQPVRVYTGMPIGQLIYFPVDGDIEVKYNQKKNAKYSGQPDRPVESMMWKNKF